MICKIIIKTFEVKSINDGEIVFLAKQILVKLGKKALCVIQKGPAGFSIKKPAKGPKPALNINCCAHLSRKHKFTDYEKEENVYVTSISMVEINYTRKYNSHIFSQKIFIIAAVFSKALKPIKGVKFSIFDLA